MKASLRKKYRSVRSTKKALSAAKRYLAAESELVALLLALDSCQGYRQLKYSSLFEYARLGLGLSESVAYNLIAVARKTRDVPALQSKLESREVTLSNARMIAPVLTPQNQEKWLQAASTLSKRELERVIAQENPRLAPVPEQARYVSAQRLELKLGVSEELMAQLRRVQDLLSSQQGKAVTLETALEVLTSEFIRREDPLEKARRVQKRSVARSEFKSAQSETESKSGVASEVPSSASSEKHLAAIDVGVGAPAAGGCDRKIDEKHVDKSHRHSVIGASELRPVPGQAVAETPQLKELRPQLFAGKDLKNSPHLKEGSGHQRESISAALQHQVHLRDGHQCTATTPSGMRCESRRWLEIHHIHWVSRGGKSELNNLTTLCRAHHRLVHS